MKRDYLKYIEFSRSIEKSQKVFKKCIRNNRLNEKEIDFIIEQNLIYLLIELDKYHVQTNIKGNYYDFSKLKIYDIDKNYLYKISNKIKRIIKSNKNIEILNKKLFSDQKFEVIIDCGNIIHRFSNSKKFNNKEIKYKYLLEFFNNVKKLYGNPLLIINKKYLKLNSDDKSNKLIFDINNQFENNIFHPPSNDNDDYYILYSALILNRKIITKDKFRDHMHIFKETDNLYDIFKIFINQNTFNHSIISKKKKIKYIKNRCIQKFDNYILIPSKNGNYLKINYSKPKKIRNFKIYEKVYSYINFLILLFIIYYFIFFYLNL